MIGSWFLRSLVLIVRRLKLVFEKSCPDCQAIDSTEVCSVGDKGEQGEDALCTPKTQIIKPSWGCSLMVKVSGPWW
jgi:hypothetical protein